MKKRKYFFSFLINLDTEDEKKAEEKTISDFTNNYIDKIEENEWFQEYEIIYQSYCIESY